VNLAGWTRIRCKLSYLSTMRWRSQSKVSPAPGFVEPCIPTVAKAAPTDDRYVFEIKYDGYRLLVRKHQGRVRVYTRRGADWTDRFPRIVQAAKKIRADCFLLDGEGIVYEKKGMPSFALLHSKQCRSARSRGRPVGIGRNATQTFEGLPRPGEIGLRECRMH
jgi:ATP-dependent DNA ligase